MHFSVLRYIVLRLLEYAEEPIGNNVTRMQTFFLNSATAQVSTFRHVIAQYYVVGGLCYLFLLNKINHVANLARGG